MDAWLGSKRSVVGRLPISSPDVRRLSKIHVVFILFLFLFFLSFFFFFVSSLDDIVYDSRATNFHPSLASRLSYVRTGQGRNGVLDQDVSQPRYLVPGTLSFFSLFPEDASFPEETTLPFPIVPRVGSFTKLHLCRRNFIRRGESAASSLNFIKRRKRRGREKRGREYRRDNKCKTLMLGSNPEKLLARIETTMADNANYSGSNPAIRRIFLERV